MEINGGEPMEQHWSKDQGALQHRVTHVMRGMIRWNDFRTNALNSTFYIASQEMKTTTQKKEKSREIVS